MDHGKKHILFLDDEPNVLEALRRTLRPRDGEWDMVYLDRPEDAWQRLLAGPCDALVTDIKMPGLSGLELIARMQATEQTRDLPVVVLTGLEDPGLKEQALGLGATDLLSKPIDGRQLVARLENVLRLKSHLDNLKTHNRLLAEELGRQGLEVRKARLRLVCRLGRVAEHRDPDTGNHVVRVGCAARAIGEALGLPWDFLERLALAAPLHDIGKIAIPDRILFKPGPLTPGEWAVMQRHCAFGEMMLREQPRAILPLLDWTAADASWLDEADPLLDMAATIALTHHERWDGSGYPLGLSGAQIPLESRIVALADVFDALTSQRPYKPACPEDKALRIVRAQVGEHFDPEIYAGFLKALDDVRAVRARLVDAREDPFSDGPCGGARP